ncbi:grpE protein homolog 2, mitochondrial-like [Wolffia australiana]
MTSRVLARLSRARHGLIHPPAALRYVLKDQAVCAYHGVDSVISSTNPYDKWMSDSMNRSYQLHRLRFWSSTSSRPEDDPTTQVEGKEEAFDNAETPEMTEADDELSIDDLIKLVDEKEELLKKKHKEIEKMQDKVLRSYAEMENVIDRTKREAENSKKFAIQNFAKSLLDVADNLGRASSVVQESFSKLEASKDPAAAMSVLKTLLEGVDMTDKQLSEVFKKFGLEKFDPTNEHFDPHRHHAVFQIPDASKEPGTVAVVLKAGYMLYDRIIRPAEVGVIQAVDEANPSSDA